MNDDRPAGPAEKLLSPGEVARGSSILGRIRAGLETVIIGQPELLDSALTALAARGHLLIEGLPGLGKTELVKALATLVGLSFKRIQFTPDLLPGDITGGSILEERDGKRAFVFHPGPVFANVVLADEINRASPKTQAALLEAMQEHRVTVLGETRPLPQPFFVLATQNPIELEGTYPLPEAQLDRFLLKAEVLGISEDAIVRILKERHRGVPPPVAAAVTPAELGEVFALVDRVFLPDPVARYAARLVRATDRSAASCPESIRGLIRYPASPRAGIALAEAGRATALLAGRPNVDFEDVQRLARPALAHRLVLDHAARLAGITPAGVVARLLEAIPALEDVG